LEHLGQTAQGIVVLHHALLAYPQWPLWRSIAGIEGRSFGHGADESLSRGTSSAPRGSHCVPSAGCALQVPGKVNRRGYGMMLIMTRGDQMQSTSSARLTIVPNVVGGILFLIGAARFYGRNDLVGAVIFGVSGALALFLAAANYSRAQGGSE